MPERILDNLGPILLGLVLIVSAAVTFAKKRAYTPVDAVCLRVSSAWFYTADAASKGRRGLFRYTYQGKEYTAEDRSFLNPAKLTAGRTYRLYVDPDAPEVFITEFACRYAVIFLIAGLLFVFAAPLLF